MNNQDGSVNNLESKEFMMKICSYIEAPYLLRKSAEAAGQVVAKICVLIKHRDMLRPNIIETITSEVEDELEYGSYVISSSYAEELFVNQTQISSDKMLSSMWVPLSQSNYLL